MIRYEFQIPEPPPYGFVVVDSHGEKWTRHRSFVDYPACREQSASEWWNEADAVVTWRWLMERGGVDLVLKAVSA